MAKKYCVHVAHHERSLCPAMEVVHTNMVNEIINMLRGTKYRA